MAKWEDFYPMVRPNVQGCPLSIVDAAIKAACIEFCEKSLIYNMETACGDLISGKRDYKYNNRDGISIVMPIKVIIRDYRDGKCEDHHVQNTNLQDLDTYYPNWRQLSSEFPTRFYMKDSNTLIFVEAPIQDVPNSIHLLCAVKPSRNSEGVPNFLFEDWAETISHGALSRLHSMLGRVWANPQMVSYHSKNFIAGISRAKSKMYKSYTTQSKTMLPKTFI